MILQALKDYYDRSDSKLPSQGFEWKEIPFVIEIDFQGNFIQVEKTYEGEGRQKKTPSFLVPQGVKKTSGIVANLLWDNPSYALGMKDEAKKPGRVEQQHKEFINKIKSMPQDDEGIRAVLSFLQQANRESFLKRAVEQGLTAKDNITFRLQGDEELVCQRPRVQEAILAMNGEKGDHCESSLCLITGKMSHIARLHTSIKGVWGAKPSGANIVSFNLEAFNSYGKSQGGNAPIGDSAMFKYTTSLNHLLQRGSRQRLQVGDTSTVFWADKPTKWESQIVDIFGQPPKDDPNRSVQAVKSLYQAVSDGLLANDKDPTRFFVLGLAPNASRLSIRFWYQGTVAEMAGKIKQHFDDLAIEHSPDEIPYLSLFRLLVSVAIQGKSENIPPHLGGELMRSVLTGFPYPRTLLTATLRRIRAEREREKVTYPRAAIIKSYINRFTRYLNSNIKEELKMSLDEANTNVGYCLGRLFAVLEKIQEEAHRSKVNATIRDRYYGAAASTPVTVFPTLLRLKNHHLSKLENRGRAVNLEKRVGEIMEGLGDFPNQLLLIDQGRFAIGYYHQRQSFFKKTESDSSESEKLKAA